MSDDQTSVEGKRTMPVVQPEQHGRAFKGIIVEYPSYCVYPEYKGKPYFEIKYTENGQEFIGYGTYKPEALSEFLKEYFIPSAHPEMVKCKKCRYVYYDEEFDNYWCNRMSDSFKVEADGYCKWGR